MAKSARAALETRRGSLVTWFTFIVGVPLGVGALHLVHHGPWQNETIQRYVTHEAEQAVVVLFFCCVSAFLAKLCTALRERVVHAQNLLPAWDGKQIAPSEVTQLQQKLNLAWDGVKSTYLGRRVANILNFVASRGSANDLDDQMRTLSDNDALAVDSSYAILRFMIWAMPILGFLGTVLGITEAIGQITPAQMEQGVDGISQGLTKAFDATALALSFTLVAMLFNSLLEKMEHGLIERVDHYVDSELAHRFHRAQASGSGLASLSPSLQQLLESQVSLWSDSMHKAEERWTQAAPQMAQALQQALDGILNRFGQRMVETEKKLLERQQIVVDGLGKLTTTLKDSGREQQMAIARLTDAISMSVEVLARAKTDEAQLLRLQESLSQNLALLANSATFEQAIESLTGAIHLLTTRVHPNPALRVVPSQHAA